MFVINLTTTFQFLTIYNELREIAANCFKGDRPRLRNSYTLELEADADDSVGDDCCGETLKKSNGFGTIETGKFIAITAVANDLLKDIMESERVKFVMKNGETYRDEFSK